MIDDDAPPPIMRPVTHTYKGRLTTPPLPEEIAGLINDASFRPMDRATQVKVLVALRELAQENAENKTIADQRWEIANARIRELEQENERLRKNIP